jgi:hypothetical protein
VGIKSICFGRQAREWREEVEVGSQNIFVGKKLAGGLWRAMLLS